MIKLQINAYERWWLKRELREWLTILLMVGLSLLMTGAVLWLLHAIYVID